MGILDSLGRLLGKKERDWEAAFPYQKGYKAPATGAAPATTGAAAASAQSGASPTVPAPAAAPAPSSSSFVSLGSMGLTSEPPKRRTVVQSQATVSIAGATTAEPAPADPNVIRIKAEPHSGGESCKLMASKPVFPGKSWYFDDSTAAGGSPLAEKIFGLAGVVSVLIDDSTVTITRNTKQGDWKELATEIGRLVRAQLESAEPAVSSAITDKIPAEDEVRAQIQKVIDFEVNPGVAAHSGHISLTAVRGNSVYIKMGGGCQGCSAADLTLKEGIHRSFRTAVPFVGAIYDETDHKAGLNPYFR